jgi:Transposase domain (DUF772)
MIPFPKSRPAARLHCSNPTVRAIENYECGVILTPYDTQASMTAMNLAYRWFCRLGLDGDVPDHSTFSRTRRSTLGRVGRHLGPARMERRHGHVGRDHWRRAGAQGKDCRRRGSLLPGCRGASGATPDRLLEVEGIGKVRLARITTGWGEQKTIRAIMVFLQGHGIGTSRAVRIFKTYGADAIPGRSFDHRTADEILRAIDADLFAFNAHLGSRIPQIAACRKDASSTARTQWCFRNCYHLLGRQPPSATANQNGLDPASDRVFGRRILSLFGRGGSARQG